MKSFLKNKKLITKLLAGALIAIYTFYLFSPLVSIQQFMEEDDENTKIVEDAFKLKILDASQEFSKNQAEENVVAEKPSSRAGSQIIIPTKPSLNQKVEEKGQIVKVENSQISFSHKGKKYFLFKPKSEKQLIKTAKSAVEEIGKAITEGVSTAKSSIAVKHLKKPEYRTPKEEVILTKASIIETKITSDHKRHGNIKIYKKPKYTFLTLRMHNLNTGEHLATVFYQNGEYSRNGLQKINKFLRDYRTGEVIKIDPKLIMLVYRISRRLKHSGYIEVISGYRSKKTNDKLRRMGRNVAKKSMHTQGKAIDVRFPGVSTKKLKKVAESYRAGGVGYYPQNGFVHVDTGPLRTW